MNSKTKSPVHLDFLKKVSLFESFPETTLDTISQKCKVLDLDHEETLCEEGTFQNNFYVILKGKVLVYKSRKIINTLGPGDYFGEMALIDHQPRAASIRGLGPATLLEISDDFFKAHILTEPKAIFALLTTLNQRNRHSLELVSVEHQRLCCLVHDIRNYLIPLSISEGYMGQTLGLMQGTHPNEKRRRGCDEITMGLEKMITVRSNLISLIDQTLHVGLKKLSQYVKKPDQILDLFTETIDEIRYHNNVKGKKLALVIPPYTILKVSFNYLDIKRVLQNLLINAGYASKPGGLIEIGIQNKRDEVEVSVRDYGEGIPDDVKPLLLKEKFTTKSHGNGLGLLSCREIIEDYHFGRFWFESETGKGTTFYFTLPLR